MPFALLVLLCAVSSAWNRIYSISPHGNLYSPFKIQVQCHVYEALPTLPGNWLLLSLFSQSTWFLPLISVLTAMDYNNLLACPPFLLDWPLLGLSMFCTFISRTQNLEWRFQRMLPTWAVQGQRPEGGDGILVSRTNAAAERQASATSLRLSELFLPLSVVQHPRVGLRAKGDDWNESALYKIVMRVFQMTYFISLRVLPTPDKCELRQGVPSFANYLLKNKSQLVGV